MRAGIAAVKRNAWYCKFSASQCPLPTPSKWSTSIRWCKDQQCHLKQSHCWRECNEPRSVQWKCQVSITSRKNWHILLHLGIQSCKYSHTHVSQNHFTGAHGITHKLLKKKVSVASHRVAFWFLCGELTLNRLFYINGDLNTTKPLKGTGSSCVLIAF